jgi:LCP family protein required for cell wall assembly
MEARRTAGLAARVLLAFLSVAVLAAAGFGWVLQQQLRSETVTSDALTRVTPIPEGQPFTALLVGLDARTDAAGKPLPPRLLDALHAGPDEGQLHTDTMILLRVPGRSGGPATAISIPRDSYVPIVGERGKHKINSAYRRGVEEAEESLAALRVTGPELDRRAREAGRQKLIGSVENLTGVTVDHFAEINLAGFVELTEALGGVPVCLNNPVRDSYSGVNLPAGRQSVSGAGALAFVRQRHGLDGGDLDRIARQQAFAAGLARSLQGGGGLADTRRLNQLASIISRHVVLDRSWDLDEAIGQLRRFTGADLVFRTIPTGRVDLQTPVDGVAIEIDQPAVRAFVASVLDPAALAAPPARMPSASIAPAATPRPATAPAPTATPPPDASRAGAARSAGTAGGVTTSEPASASRVITSDGIPCVD